MTASSVHHCLFDKLLAMAEKKLKEAIELRKGYQLALRQANRDDAKKFKDVSTTQVDQRK